MGLEDIPEAWKSALSEVLGELLRNSIEHGIESTAQRTQRAKPEMGTLVVEFIDRGAHGFDLNMQDDGGGLNAERMAEVAVRLGLLSAQAAATLDAPRSSRACCCNPAATSARIPGQRGLGLQIVREQVHRHGRAAAGRGQARPVHALPDFAAVAGASGSRYGVASLRRNVVDGQAAARIAHGQPRASARETQQRAVIGQQMRILRLAVAANAP
jgi:hypothetical protein